VLTEALNILFKLLTKANSGKVHNMQLFNLEFKDFREKNWYICSDPVCADADEYALTNMAKTLAPQAHAQYCQVFCGLFDNDQSNHALFAIFNIHPCDLINEFRVGSHNNNQQVVNQVYAQMVKIYNEIRSFHPYFVDQAGYHCIFEGRITKIEAEKIEAVLTQGMEWYCSNYDENSIVPSLVSENEIHLWWG
jgi:hypothetical protein